MILFTERNFVFGLSQFLIKLDRNDFIALTSMPGEYE